jgi:hypothetical protein
LLNPLELHMNHAKKLNHQWNINISEPKFIKKRIK